MSEYMASFMLLSLIVGIAAWIPRKRTRLPDPDRSTQRRPVVDPFWQVGVGYERHTRHERRVGERRAV